MARRAKGKHKNKRGVWLITVFVLCILFVVGYKSIGLASEQVKKEKELFASTQKIEDEKQRTVELEQKKAYVQTKEYIEDIAKRYLGLVYPDNVIIKPNE